MNKILIATILIAAAGLTVVRAQYSQYGAVENFYQANPDLGTNQYAGLAALQGPTGPAGAETVSPLKSSPAPSIK